MKIKEIDRTANVSWSPAKKYPIFLAAATAAQQLDATFSTSACLELYKLAVCNPSKELELEAFINIDSRLNKLVWSGNDDASNNGMSDLLIGGADEGKLFIWDPNLILEKKDPLKHILTKHSGAVASLDVNPFQLNLLASGAGDSEIFIWDLNNPDNPMTPGSKIQPEADVTHLAWNRQVQAILASTHSGNCVVWDLRKNDPIIKIRDSMSRIKSKTICWHPDVATQLCVSSEDDHTPVVQVWDLRSATSPLKVLEAHNRGILSMSWSPEDSNLLISSAKDNRILCWNPNANNPADQLIYEMKTGTEWSYDVQWCPRCPNLLSGCSFDGHVSIYDVMASSNQHASSMVADSFSAAEPTTNKSSCQATMPLTIAPKWMCKPCGASFAFGGKLLTFEGLVGGGNEVRVSQVVTEEDLVTRATMMESAFEDGNVVDYCEKKIEELKGGADPEELETWEFLKVNCGTDSQQKYLQLLGHEALKSEPSSEDSILESEVKDLHLDEPLSINTADDKEGRITECLLVGDFENAVSACLRSNYEAEALILASVGGGELLQKTQEKILKKNRSPLHLLISSIIHGDIEEVVARSEASNWKEVLTLILTYSSSQNLILLCNLLGSKLEQASDQSLHSKAQLCYIVAGNVAKLVDAWRQEGALNTHHLLQDLIEKVRILESCRHTSISQLGEMTDYLQEYAVLLAEQGCASTALKYLGTTATDQMHLSLLKERLYNSLTAQQRSSFAKPQATFQDSNLTTPTPQQTPNNYGNTYGGFNGNVHGKSHTQQSPPMHQQPSYHHMQPLTNNPSRPQIASRNNSLTSQTPQPHQPIFNPLSDYDAPSYHNNTYNQSPPLPNSAASTPMYYQQQHQPLSQPQQQPPQQQRHQPPPQQHQPPPQQHQPPPQQHQPQQHQPPPQQHQPQQHQPPPQQHQPPPQQHQPPPQQPQSQQQAYTNLSSSLANNSQFNNYNLYNPTSYTPSQQTPAYPPSQPEMTSYQPPKPAAAWNDPPMLSSTKPKKTDATTKPSFEGLLYNPQDYQQQPAYNQPPLQPQQNATQAPAVAQRHRQVSERDQLIKDSFDQLSVQCLANASNPATRKKIDDVSKKLEILYDMLADGKLSPRVTAVIHQIVSATKSSDFQTALHYHSQLVSAGSFSEISSFGTSVKMLLQTALQLNVFMQ